MTTVRSGSKPSAVLLDANLYRITTQARLLEQLEQLPSAAELLDEDLEEEVADEDNFPNAAIAKKVSNILFLSDSTDVSRG